MASSMRVRKNSSTHTLPNQFSNSFFDSELSKDEMTAMMSTVLASFSKGGLVLPTGYCRPGP